MIRREGGGAWRAGALGRALRLGAGPRAVPQARGQSLGFGPRGRPGTWDRSLEAQALGAGPGAGARGRAPCRPKPSPGGVSGEVERKHGERNNKNNLKS